MKFLLASFFAVTPAFASVVRSVDSSPKDYSERSKETYVEFQMKTFKDVNATQTPGLDEALQALYQNEPQAQELTKEAIKNIQGKVLNLENKQVLLFLLRRSYEKFNDGYSLLRMKSLVRSDVGLMDLIEDDRLKNILSKDDMPSVMSVANFVSAFKQRTDLAGSQFLVDGVPFELNPHFKIPQGVFQWTLISNVYSQFVFIGSWEEFTIKLLSRSGLNPLVEGDCINFKTSSELRDLSAQVFFSKKCVLDANGSRNFYSVGKNTEKDLKSDLTLPSLPEIHNERANWAVPALTLLAVGIAYGLKDKHVAIKAPALKF